MSPSKTDRLEVRRLRFDGSGVFSLSLSPRECVCLSGPSGCGKSRLLRAIADLEPHEGEVFLDGQPCSGIHPQSWRQRVALLPAESRWWAERAGEHFAHAGAIPLEELGLGEELLERPVSRLSSGERQRLALLRVLANQPGVLLLDEPTANLDRESEARVEQLVSRYQSQAGAAVIWVSHDRQQIERLGARHLSFNGRELIEQPGSAR